MLSYNGKLYSWNKGRLSRIYQGASTQPGSLYENCQFTYDAYGRRIAKNYTYDPNPGSTNDYSYSYRTTYNYDNSGRLIREYTVENYITGTTTREFIFLYDESGIIGVMYGYNGATLQPYYFHKNLQGDVIAIYDASGNIKAEYAYDAYGNCKILKYTLYDLSVNNPIRYRSYYLDRETGLYFLNTRYYNPEWRRFISPDSTDYLDPESVNGLNLYVYCGNDPVNYADPSGHSAWLIAIAAILLFTPVGGAALQVATSVVSYAGIAIASIFDEDIRKDMNDIHWNPFNTDEAMTLKSTKVSFYKGVPVFRTNSGRSGSFGAILLRRKSNVDTLRHERGHNWQLMMMGVANYGLMIGLPSWQEWSNRSYDDRPWEITADVLGGATRSHTKEDICKGYLYLVTSSLFGPLGYLFLFGEY